MLRSAIHLTFICLLALSLAGCAKTVLADRGAYLRAYHGGNFDQAETDLTNTIRKELPQTRYNLSKNSSWLFLDRATVRFAEGEASEAIEDYATALEAMDYYGKSLLTEQVAQIILQDEESAYQAPDYEQVLARVYLALALLHQGDGGNAFAILRQAEEFQQEKQNLYSNCPFLKSYKVPANGLSKYLFAVLLEKKGDRSNAEILYKQAEELIPCSCEVSFKPSDSPKDATVIVLCHNGNAPYKISTLAPASQVSALALEFFLANEGVPPSCASLPGIPVPEWERWPGSAPLPTFALMDDCNQPLLPFYSVVQASAQELEVMKPILIARGITRLLVRRATVGFMRQKDPTLGALADCAMLIANLNTRIDTRSWTTLPAFIDVARFDIEAGCHTITLQVIENHKTEEKSFNLNLKENDLCIIHVFNIHPGVRRVLVPFRNQALY